MYSRYNKN